MSMRLYSLIGLCFFHFFIVSAYSADQKTKNKTVNEISEQKSDQKNDEGQNDNLVKDASVDALAREQKSNPIFDKEELHRQSELLKVKQSYQKMLSEKYSLMHHKGTYLLPYVYNWHPNEDLYESYKTVEPKNKDKTYYKNVEAEFQISFLFPVYRKVFLQNLDLMFAYTHHSWWQIYNNSWSKPFRETNYSPELFLRYMDFTPQKFFGIDLIAVDLGYQHESNGQIQTFSRSWDRITGRAYLHNDFISGAVSLWYRLPSNPNQDDNKDINNYTGIGEIELLKAIGKHTIHFKTPIFANRPSFDLKYSYPWEDRLRWFVSFQSGFAHSLIEYNRETQRLGVGLTLESFFDNAN